jgi:putative aldouronate transport system substrate-binding protein
MKKKFLAGIMAALMGVSTLTGCGSTLFGYDMKTTADADPESVKLPLKEQATITGMTSYPSGTQSDPNERTIFKRLEEKTNVHVDWTAISSDQWSDKISLQMVNFSTLPDFIFSAGFGDSDLLNTRAAVILRSRLHGQVHADSEQVLSEIRIQKMATDTNGHFWGFLDRQLGKRRRLSRQSGICPSSIKSGSISSGFRFQRMSMNSNRR